MPENQEIKTPIETNKEVSVSKESTTPDSFSSIQNNPLFQAQLNTYKTEHPEIEKNITDYLQKDPEKTDRINNQINNPNLDEGKKIKIINMIIDNCMKEVAVFPKQEKINNEPTPELDTKKITEKIQTNTEKIQITEGKEIINKLFEKLNSQQNDVVKKHPNLKINTEETSKKLESSGTIKILRDKGLSDDHINSFIKFKATQEAIQADPSIQDADSFLLSFKQLENELNIPDASRDSFSSKNITETSAQIFNPDIGNQNLIDTVASNQKAHADKVQELFLAPKNIHDLDQIYGHFFPENHKIYLQIQEKQTQKTQLNQKETLFLQDYQKQLETQKSSYEQISANAMEKSAILGPIMGLADYMNMDIGNNFEFNKSNDIQIQNNRLSITGRVENQAFTLATHLDKSSKLETSDYLHPIGNNLFELDKKHTQATPYILPGQQEIWTTITDNFAKIQTELLAQGLTPSQYQEVLQKTLCEQIKTLYGKKELVQARMEKQIAKDIANQATLDMLNDSFFHGKYEYGKSISISENPELFNFVKDFDKTLEAASSDEIRNWTTSLSQLKIILERAETGESKKNNTDIFKSFNKDIVVNTKDSMSRKDHKKPTLFSFFSCLKNPKTKTLELDEFSRLIEENNKSQPNPNRYPTIQKQWNDLQHQIQQENNNKKTEHEQKEADRELNESLSNI